MLKRLLIENYAIIDKLEIELGSGLHIITGETGAGKSILLGALSMVLGQRADTSVLRDVNTKTIIEATFDISHYDLNDFFIKNDLDFETHSIFRREIAPSGKSRAFINDTPVNLNILKEISSRLINVHSQHDTLELATPAFQLNMLDQIAENDTLQAEHSKNYYLYKSTEKKITALKKELEQNLADKDFITFQLNELNQLTEEDQSLEELEQELNTQQHAEEIKVKLNHASDMLQNSEYAIQTHLDSLLTELSSIKKILPSIAELYSRLESISIDLKDISNEIEHLEADIIYDPNSLDIIQEKVNFINKLLHKHQAENLEKLYEIRETYTSKLSLLENSDFELDSLQSTADAQKKELQKSAALLSESRQAAIEPIETEVNKMIRDLGMPHSMFQIRIDKKQGDLPGEKGIDEVAFLFSANKGSRPDEIKKVASGGELSRLMLSIKSLLAEKTALPTLIFDEIDTGVSGEVALKVGKLLEKAAKGIQIISITHLPQIAARGDMHFYVYKDESADKVNTRMKLLSPAEREQILAKMLSGEAYTDAALENARQLLKSSV